MARGRRRLAALAAVLMAMVCLIASVQPAQALSWSGESEGRYYQNAFSELGALADGVEEQLAFRGRADVTVWDSGYSRKVENAANYALRKVEVTEAGEYLILAAVSMDDGAAFRDEEFVIAPDLTADDYASYFSDSMVVKKFSGLSSTSEAQIEQTVFLMPGTYFVGIHATNTSRSGTAALTCTRQGAWSAESQIDRYLPGQSVLNRASKLEPSGAGDEVRGTFAFQGDREYLYSSGSASSFSSTTGEDAGNYSLFKIELSEPSEITLHMTATMDDGAEPDGEEFGVYFESSFDSGPSNQSWTQKLTKTWKDGKAVLDKTLFLAAGTYFVGVHGTRPDVAGKVAMRYDVEGAWSGGRNSDQTESTEVYYYRNHFTKSPILSAGTMRGTAFSSATKRGYLARFADSDYFYESSGSYELLEDANNYTLFKVELAQATQIEVAASVTYDDGAQAVVEDEFVLFGDMTRPDKQKSDPLWSEKATVAWDGLTSAITKTFFLKRGTYYVGFHAGKVGRHGSLSLSYKVKGTFEETFPEDMYGYYNGTKNDDIATARPIELGQTVIDFESLSTSWDYYTFTITEEGEYAVNNFLEDGPSYDYRIADVNNDAIAYGTAYQPAVGYGYVNGSLHLKAGKYFIYCRRSNGSDGPSAFNVHKAQPVTVTFDSQGGSDVPRQQLLECRTLEQLPANPTRAGYTFNGWYFDKDFKNPFNPSAAIFKSITLYAKWTRAETFTVTYDLGYVDQVQKLEVTWGALAENRAPSRAGYVFAGWFTDSQLTKPYDFTLPVTSNLTLHAKWVKESDASSYDLADFRIGDDAAAWKYPTKRGKAFAGWFTDASLKTPVPADQKNGIAYAKFVALEDVIMFRGGSLRLSDADPVTAGDMRLGYDFAAPAGATVNWEASGWSYGTKTDQLKFATTVRNYLSNGNGSYTANIVFTGVPLVHFDDNIYAMAHLAYTTADGTLVVLQDSEVRSRSVIGVVSAILDDTTETDSVRAFAMRLRKAYDALYSKYH